MNRTIRAVIGTVLVLVIAFSAISVCQNVGKSIKADITEQKIYTLSDGTKAILDKLHQQITVKLYYAKTAALKGPDQIRYFNNYYYFIKALLEEYVAQAKDKVVLEVIDPRPYSEDEVEVLRLGLKRFAITEEENFFFGLVVQTPFGVEKVIPFFSPERQRFVEYDISYLIDTAITRTKKKIGILSSLPVMGQDVSGYMAQMMRMQGQRPTPSWTFVEQLRKRYEVTQVPTDVNEITDIDILLVIHPKELPEPTLFAIDQFVLKGGRTVVCVDPHCIADRPAATSMQMRMSQKQSSDLNLLLKTWGLEMPENTFAGDRTLALRASLSREQRPQKVIGFLNLIAGCFNTEQVITSELNQVKVLFAGVLREFEIEEPKQELKDEKEQDKGEETKQQVHTGIKRAPLLMTTDSGNGWTVSGPYELMFPDPARLMAKFIDGVKPVHMGYLVTGRFMSAFPGGIEVEQDSSDDPNDKKKIKKLVTGLKQAEQDCAVVVFSDVDFISDIDGMAYQDSFFGKIVVGDNSALMLNTIESLSGSSDLISIRSRGNFRRPFTVVSEIEQEAEQETAEEVAKLNAEIEGFTKKIQDILTSAKKQEAGVVGSSIVREQRELETRKREAQRQLKQVKLIRFRRIEHLGNALRNLNVLTAPAVILVIAIGLAIYRSVRKRHYISHASDA